MQPGAIECEISACLVNNIPPHIMDIDSLFKVFHGFTHIIQTPKLKPRQGAQALHGWEQKANARCSNTRFDASAGYAHARLPSAYGFYD